MLGWLRVKSCSGAEPASSRGCCSLTLRGNAVPSRVLHCCRGTDQHSWAPHTSSAAALREPHTEQRGALICGTGSFLLSLLPRELLRSCYSVLSWLLPFSIHGPSSEARNSFFPASPLPGASYAQTAAMCLAPCYRLVTYGAVSTRSVVMCPFNCSCQPVKLP